MSVISDESGFSFGDFLHICFPITLIGRCDQLFDITETGSGATLGQKLMFFCVEIIDELTCGKQRDQIETKNMVSKGRLEQFVRGHDCFVC